jgi:hypothetical protein
MQDHLVDKDWGAQSMKLSECAHPFEYAVMRDHLANDECAAQPIPLRPCAHPLQYAAIGDHLADNALLAQRRKRRALTFKSNKNCEEKEHHWSEVSWPIEIECIGNLPVIGSNRQRYGSVGLNSSKIDPDSIDPLKNRFRCSFLRGI